MEEYIKDWLKAVAKARGMTTEEIVHDIVFNAYHQDLYDQRWIDSSISKPVPVYIEEGED